MDVEDVVLVGADNEVVVLVEIVEEDVVSTLLVVEEDVIVALIVEVLDTDD